MNVNANVRSNLVPKSNLPRTRYDFGVVRVLDSATHGLLTPFFCQFSYPNETWQMEMSVLCQADIAATVPLDHIYHDIYFFHVPIRILDPNFKKVLGDVDPYDDTEYAFPQIKFHVADDDSIWSFENLLLNHLGWNMAHDQSISDYLDDDEVLHTVYDEVCAYPLMAFWSIYNEFFRSEILDASVDISVLLDTVNPINIGQDGDYPAMYCPQVNKYHDYFTNAFTSPMRGDEPTINLNQPVPVGFVPDATASFSGSAIAPASGSTVADKFFGLNRSLTVGGDTLSYPIIADLAAGQVTINSLRLAWQLTALYERKQIYGTRYTEILAGQWGITVPDEMLDRPEYLGGSRETLSMYPVLNQANDLGLMAGSSKTVLKGCSWSKSFHEFGLVIGLHCTRVRHMYSQGKDPSLWGLKTELDLYNPLFANIGMQAIKNFEIYNSPDDPKNDEVFGYTEAWSRLRSIPDRCAGIFSPASKRTGYSDFRTKWSYQDLYAERPSLSDTWLKEDPNNVKRSLTGRLIPGAPEISSDPIYAQPTFAFGFYLHPIITRPLPPYSIPVELTGSL